MKQYYAIIRADGGLKLRKKAKRGTGSLFTNKADAIRQADDDGDAVVAVVFDPAVKPVFIRHKVLDPNLHEPE